MSVALSLLLATLLGLTAVAGGLAVRRARRRGPTVRELEALAHQARLLDTLHDAVITLDPQLQVRSWNKAADRIYGWSAGEAIGRHIREVSGTEYADGEAGRARLFGAVAAAGFLHSDLVQHRRDGTRIEMECETSLLRGADGAVTGYLLVNRDVTERRTAREALRESEVKYRSLFKLAPSGVVLLDEQGRILEFNDQAHQDLGYSREEFERLAIADLDVEEAPADIDASLAQVHQRGHGEFEVRHRTKTGEMRDVLVSTRPLEIGLARRFLAVWQDVTERNRAAQALRHSDALLRVLSDTVPDPMFVKDREGRWLFSNPAALAVLGKTSEEVLGRKEREVWADPAMADALAEIDRRVMERGIAETVEETIRTPEGDRIYLTTKAPYRDLDGQVIGVIGSARDITARKRSEGEVSQDLAFLETLVETIPSAIFYKGIDGRYLGCNSAFAGLWGLTRQEVVGKTVEDLAPPDLAQRFRDADRALLREPGTLQYEASVPSPGGAPRPVVVRKATFQGPDGRAAGIVGVMMDITELRALQEQLMQADRLVSVGTLAAGVAHEINNPLAYVVGALEFVAEELVGCQAVVPAGRLEEARTALSEAREGTERIKHIVRDLKTFSRSGEDRHVRVDLQRVVESSINIAFNEIKHRARLVRLFGPTPPVLGNEARLGQVFLNLLINAAQAIPEGQAAANEIRVVTGTDAAGRATVEVHDTGSGIPAAVRGLVFEPFFTTKPVGVGTGLGLSICRNIVRALSGDIVVESQEGKGSVFRVTLPPAPAEVAAPVAEAPDPRGRLGRRGRVLVVDDEPTICRALRRILGAEHEVVTLTDAREALDLIARGERFDVILCDLMMPQVTGMDLHAELTRSVRDQAERMVLLTGGAFTSRASQFLDQVRNLRVEKPFDSAALQALVRSLVQRHPAPT